PYYARFGFERSHAEGLALPGPVEAERFLGLELVAGSLAGASGMLTATGRPAGRSLRKAA
ncbi:MAG: GNAT family N-acetyltransferase, partial [Rhodobiaceae bacterium]|nr:GNAT family N-acetyltransferase [Rhodobiaceae bacterium]